LRKLSEISFSVTRDKPQGDLKTHKTLISWNVTPSNLVDIYHYLGETFYPYLKCRWKQLVAANQTTWCHITEDRKLAIY